MHRYKTGKLLGLCCALLLISGCATQSTKNRLAQNTLSESRTQQATLQDLAKLYQAGRQHQQAGDFPAAIAAYEKILAIDPAYVEAHNGLGVVHAQMDNPQLAVRHLTTAIELAPLASHLHNNLGYAYLLQGNLADAERGFQQALQLDPENEQARANLMTVRQRLRATGE
ncbi:tetratricopeptide repeat protein [Nitrosomonas sp. ANs5]|uniref:tetratricopeptide repeat protein n=1 Tax=Nitrosomonas sp. ANs5 TaxID=3423941 RepID=UPI003D3381F2